MTEKGIRKAAQNPTVLITWLECLFENSKDPIAFADANGNLQAFNKAFEDLTGYSRDELVENKTFMDITPEEYEAFEAGRVRGVFETGASAEYEKEYIRKDGRRVPVLLNAFQVKDEAGQPFGTGVIIKDLTERKLAETQMKDLAKFPSEDPSPVLRVQADGTVLYSNEAGYLLLDEWSAQIGKRLPRIWLDLIADILSSNEVKRGVELSHGGRIFTFTCVPIARGMYVNFYGLDITEQRRVEEERAQNKSLSDALNDINVKLAATLDITDILLKIMEAAISAIGCDTGAVIELEGDTWTPMCMHTDLPHGFLDRPFVGGETRHLDLAALTKRTIAVDDAMTDSRVDHDLMKALGVRSFIIVPLLTKDRVTGALAFHYRSAPRAFRGNQIDFAEKLGASMSFAIQNARNYDTSQKALADKRVVSRVLERISQSLALDEVLDIALTELTNVLSLQHGCIYVYDGAGRLVIRAEKRLSEAFLSAKRTVALGEGCAGRSAEEQRIFAPKPDEHDVFCEESKKLLGLDCMATAPIMAKGEVLGVLEFFAPLHRRLSSREVDVIAAVANQLGQAIENANLYSRERDIAELLQEAQLTVPERLEGLDFTHVYRSAATEAGEAGGDFYDLFELDEDRVAVVIGDVAGKGLEASTVTSIVKNSVKAYAFEGHSPAQVLTLVNTVVLESTAPAVFATVFLAELDRSSGTLTYCSGGHPPGILKTKTGEASYLKTASPMIGAFPGPEYVDDEMTLMPGDSLVLYTDGVTEAKCGTGLFGEDELIKIVKERGERDVKELATSIFQEVSRTPDCTFVDDVAILTISPLPRSDKKARPAQAA